MGCRSRAQRAAGNGGGGCARGCGAAAVSAAPAPGREHGRGLPAAGRGRSPCGCGSAAAWVGFLCGVTAPCSLPYRHFPYNRALLFANIYYLSVFPSPRTSTCSSVPRRLRLFVGAVAELAGVRQALPSLLLLLGVVNRAAYLLPLVELLL